MTGDEFEPLHVSHVLGSLPHLVSAPSSRAELRSETSRARGDVSAPAPRFLPTQPKDHP